MRQETEPVQPDVHDTIGLSSSCADYNAGHDSNAARSRASLLIGVFCATPTCYCDHRRLQRCAGIASAAIASRLSATAQSAEPTASHCLMTLICKVITCGPLHGLDTGCWLARTNRCTTFMTVSGWAMGGANQHVEAPCRAADTVDKYIAVHSRDHKLTSAGKAAPQAEVSVRMHLRSCIVAAAAEACVQ